MRARNQSKSDDSIRSLTLGELEDHLIEECTWLFRVWQFLCSLLWICNKLPIKKE
jgi:hypothetical protein